MLSPADAIAGRNFLAPDIARLARHITTAYREVGALIDERRLFANALSSQTLAFNLFAPMLFDLSLATSILGILLPRAEIRRVLHIAFEHSPGRGDRQLTGDSAAFDVAVAYEGAGGKRGFVGIEIKYSEGMGDAAPAIAKRYDEIAEASGLFKEPATALLRFTGLRQLCREHLLAQAAVMRGDWDEAHFVVVAPQDNHPVGRAAELYGAQLVAPLPGHVPFDFVTLEAVIAAIDRVGATGHATALHYRYKDWSKVDRLVLQFLGAAGGQLAPGADFMRPAKPHVRVHQVAHLARSRP